MIHITIADIDYKIFDEWNDIPLHSAIELYSYCKVNIPKKIKDKIDIIIDNIDSDSLADKIQEWELNNIDSKFKSFYLGCINILSDKKIPKNIESDALSLLYASAIELIVIGIYKVGTTHKSREITQFDYKRETYYLPKSKEVFNSVVPLESMSMVQFSEFNDLMTLVLKNDNGFDFVSTAIAVFCLKDSEVYSEDLVMLRHNYFNDLTMDVVFDLLFMQSLYFQYVSARFPILFKKHKPSFASNKSGMTYFGWRGNILDIAMDSGGISKLSYVEKLKATTCLEWISRGASIEAYKQELNKKK